MTSTNTAPEGANHHQSVVASSQPPPQRETPSQEQEQLIAEAENGKALIVNQNDS